MTRGLSGPESKRRRKRAATAAAARAPKGIVTKETLFSLPDELLLMILLCLISPNAEYKDDFGYTYGIFFGLTCTRLYNLLKKLIPGPIDTYSRVFEGNYYRMNELQRYIGEFIGPAYRFRTQDPNPDSRHVFFAFHTPFLSKAVYGISYGPEEERLNNRWKDWAKMRAAFLSSGKDDAKISKPYGRGEDWEREELYEPVSKMLMTCLSKAGNCQNYGVMSIYYNMKKLYCYERYVRHYEQFWDALEEWRELVGF